VLADPAPPDGAGRAPRVLVVEDDRSLRDVLLLALTDTAGTSPWPRTASTA
jgi:hypothetical protein